MTKILVTGATGTIGSQLVSMLVEQEQDVRVAVRSPEKAQPWAQRGVEVVRYDLEQGIGVDEAFAGVDRVFLLTPFVPGFSALTKTAVTAAARAGVRHVVKLSASGAAVDADLWLAREHGEGDAAVADSGLSYTILRPTFFQDNILSFSAATIAQQSTFYGAGGTQGAAYVSSRDVAAVAAQALLHPPAHAGKTYDLTGGEAVTGAALARLLSEVAGREISYTDLTLEQYADGARANGTPEPFVEAFVGLERVKANGWAAAVSPHVEAVLGRPPERYADFLARHRDRLPAG